MSKPNNQHCEPCSGLAAIKWKYKHGLSITNKTGTLDRWLRELKIIAVSHFQFSEKTQFDIEAWETYYDQGYIPWDAMVEDLTYA